MVAPPQDLQAINNFTLVISNQLSVVSDDAKTQLTTDNKLLTDHKQWKKAVEEYAKRLEMLLNDAEFNFNGWQQWGEVLESLKPLDTQAVIF
jgi:hypothetical protein